jgi:hypothetical protein
MKKTKKKNEYNVGSGKTRKTIKRLNRQCFNNIEKCCEQRLDCSRCKIYKESIEKFDYDVISMDIRGNK